MKWMLAGLALLLCANVQALEVEQAYRMIPHQRTVFLLNRTNLPASEAQQVAKLLTLAEKAMVERVNALHNGARKTGYQSRVVSILRQLNELPVPGQVDAARDHIVAALRQHRVFFDLQVLTGDEASASRQALIQSSHRHLLQAYHLLMQAYPDETRHNKQAFFDYLCALDFI